MHNAELVAAVAAGEPAGLAAAYDQFGESLYTYCHLMLPDPDEAGRAVRDTFLVASARLGELRAPDKLRSWLYAVARNECLRRRRTAGVTSRMPDVPRAGTGYAVPAAFVLPAGLRRQVLAACADNTPAGRAERDRVAHRAGAFGLTGFPRAIGSAGPQWWQQARQHPRAVTGGAVLAAVAVAVAIVAILALSGPPHGPAATLAAGRDVRGGSAAPSGTGASSAGGHRTSPATASPASASPASGTPGASATAPGSTVSPDAVVSRDAGSSSATPSATSSPAPSATATASASASVSASVAPGTLAVEPGTLELTAPRGQPASGTFLLAAEGGPVSDYTITVPADMADKVTVSPAAGALAADGFVTVTVTVTSKAAVDTTITVNPGQLAVTVVRSVGPER